MSDAIIQVKHLRKWFPVFSRGVLLKKSIGVVHAVDNIDFDIRKGETFGLVGESGCGKTTVARLILNLIEPTAGEIYFQGENVYKKFKSGNNEEKLRLRRKMQLIFQNPYGSLDPRMTVFDIISEPFIIHKHVPKKEWKDRVYKLLSLVGLEEYHAERYPHEFSGGQRQRICIARALAVEPDFLIADEPVSSLDVSIRAQILNLLGDLQKEMTLTYLYISHDLSSVRQISNRVAVMYLGEIVELADTDELFDKPIHPYTQALIQAVPIPDPETKRLRIILAGEVPSPINPPKGCRFRPRCPYAKECKKEEAPKLIDAGGGHLVACHIIRYS
ncbi:MAG TPA: oligopeptide/dipeptide ABC transporter ATP-binding protein [Candidatus Bathyarchaeia archaeon]|nr:oligopeptide/dipeptide ABC transporter ATP-binding protein [Candidatus Bathyarchaeia archaeon]